MDWYFLHQGTFWIILVLFVACLLFIIHRERQWRDFPPGPWGLPVIGSLFWLGFNPHLSLTKLAHQYGDIFTITFGSYSSIVLNSIESVRETLVKQSHVFAGRPQLYSLTEVRAGLGILFIDFSPKYELQRKLTIRSLHQVFDPRKNLDHLLNSTSQKLIHQFKQFHGKPFNPKASLRLISAHLILSTFFDANYDIDGDEAKEIVQMVEDFTSSTHPINLSDIVPWLQKLPISDFTKTRAMFQDFVRMHERLYSLAKESRTFGEQQTLTDALLDNLPLYNEGAQDAGLEITENDLVYLLADLVGAAFETIANTLSWALMLLAAHPQWQVVLQSELDDVVGSERVPKLSDRDRLPTVNAALYEVLRMSCVVPISLPHSTTQETKVRCYNIPKGTFVFVNVWAIHHDPKYWVSPHEFNPRRFLDPNGNFALPKHRSFVPFSTGARSCLGEKLAKAEIFVFFSALLQQFHLQIVHNENKNDFNGEYRLTLAPKPYLLKVKER